MTDGKCVPKTAANDCTGDDKFLHVDGTCKAACPEFYEDANDDKTCTLFETKCESDGKLLLKGDKSCVAKCDDYLFTDEAKKQCQTVTCAQG